VTILTGFDCFGFLLLFLCDFMFFVFLYFHILRISLYRQFKWSSGVSVVNKVLILKTCRASDNCQKDIDNSCQTEVNWPARGCVDVA